MAETTNESAPVKVLVTLPPGYRAVLEQERMKTGARSWAEVIRQKLGCPEPGTIAWEALIAGQGEQ